MKQARVWKFANDVDTDQIIASQYIILPTIEEMKEHAFESLLENFASEVEQGDVIVAGENFGCGSSREQAPSVLKALGVQAIIAQSFARIFFRNAINTGLPVIVCKEAYDAATQGGTLELDLSTGCIKVGGQEFTCTRLPEHMQKILNSGGLLAYLNEDGGDKEWV